MTYENNKLCYNVTKKYYSNKPNSYYPLELCLDGMIRGKREAT